MAGITLVRSNTILLATLFKKQEWYSFILGMTPLNRQRKFLYQTFRFSSNEKAMKCVNIVFVMISE